MDIGMLWFDNDKGKDMQSKVSRAAVYYREKYGTSPNLCFVHPSMLPAGQTNSGIPNEETNLSTGDVEIRATISIIPNHFWIGVH